MSRQDRHEHDRALELAASAIDYGLTAPQSAALAVHLSSCPACARSAASMHGDATALRPRMTPLPSRRVDDAVAAAIAGRRAASPSLLVLVAAALLLVALLGVAAVAGSLVLRDSRPPTLETSPAPVVVVDAGPSTTPAASIAPPSPTPSPTPLVLDPTTAHWTRLGVVGAPGSLVGVDGASGPLVGFDGGYVALGSMPIAGPPGSEPAAFFSADGASWAETRLATMVPNCPASGPAGAEVVPDAEVRAIATNGSEVVIVGEEAPHDAAACASVAASVRPVAWHSSDGRTWQRSAPFEVGGPNARATAVWAIPSGWQAAVQGGAAGTISIWESTDGLSWHQLGEPVAVGDVNAYAGAAPDGTVVLSRWADTTSGLRLFTSHDGRTWEPIKAAGGCEVAPGTTQVVGPATPGVDAWILLDDMRLCTSRDLQTWSGTTMTEAPSSVTQTRFGAIVLADACFGAGSTCAPDPRAYLTTDGVTLTPMAQPPATWGRAMADGPAGVLAIGRATGVGETAAWRLDP